MHVVATAGHVDHGKSTLVRALTGMEPDRFAEEKRRGMTIDLGFAWTTIGGEEFAFVDVPGHERFVSTMLAGVGPVAAVLLVVAADEGWMPQTEEHVEALDALGVRHVVLAVTRTDVADPAAVTEDVRRRLEPTSLGDPRTVAVSAVTGQGMEELRHALAELAATLPTPQRAEPVRLWVDRSFSIRGSGTVVTGTLGSGTLHVGDELEVGNHAVRVRGLQTLGRQVADVGAVARVAVNLRGVDREAVRRGDALIQPGAWRGTDVIDVRVGGDALPTSAVLHLGSAAVPVRVRPLGDGVARLTLARRLPMAPRDVALLRDPGLHRILGRVTVLDVDPPALRRRGAAAARALELTEIERGFDAWTGFVRAAELAATGRAVPADAVVAGEWVVDATAAATIREHLATAATREAAVQDVCRALGVPDPVILKALMPRGCAIRAGRVVDPARAPQLPDRVAAAIVDLTRDLEAAPFNAPEAGRLAALGLGTKELALAERAGALLRVTDAVVLLPDAESAAVETLARLRQPFTISEARQALHTTRRVAVPLLEFLDRRRLTTRLPDDRREVTRG